jgi:hypothetical protein
LPRIQSVYSSLEGNGLEVVAVTSNRWTNGAKQNLKERGVTMPVLVARGGITHEMCNRYGIAGVPTTYLLDAQGRVVWRQFDRLEESDLRLALAKLGVR